MKNSAYSGLGGTKTGIIIFLAMTAVVAYVFWVGVTGQPIPRWLLWAATIF